MYNLRTFNYDAFDAVPVQKRKRGNQGSRSKKQYKDMVCAFDIETTRLDAEHSIMYIWQFQAGLDWTVTGRSWKEFFRFIKRLIKHLSENQYIVVYVHNLSFEFQYLTGYYHFRPEEVFATASRRILKAEMYNHIELRCSMLHSNMSLAEYTAKMGVEHGKLSGDEFNYNALRFPWTPLTDRQIEYAVNDVRGLVEALYIEMQHDGDNLYTIPLTSTGYVRRDVKRAMHELPPFYVKNMLPDWELYTMLREAFRGGNVHANRYFAGQIIEDAHGADESSAYPTQEVTRLMPVGDFRNFADPTPERVIDLITRRRKACIMRAAFWGLRLKNRFWGAPYIPTDKSRNIVNAAFDNGRILRAEYLEITITDLDLNIILQEYEFDSVEFTNVKYTRYGKLPEVLCRCIMSYYRAKTELKNVKSEEIYYTKAKNKLNAIYGMSATNPVKPTLIYEGSGVYTEDTEKTGPELLEESNRKAFFPYQWGVWCTAWARYALEKGIRLVHDTPGAEFLYCDTDSVKYTGVVDWEPLNKEIKDRAITAGAYADDPAGVRHYLGVFEPDGDYKFFCTRGAKKYAYIDDKGLHLTLAGVKKKEGAAELIYKVEMQAARFEKAGETDAAAALLAERELNALKIFCYGDFDAPPGVVEFYHKETETAYTDRREGSRTYTERTTGKRRKVQLLPCVTIRPSVKTLSDTQEYLDLLDDSRAFIDFFRDTYGAEPE